MKTETTHNTSVVFHLRWRSVSVSMLSLSRKNFFPETVKEWHEIEENFIEKISRYQDTSTESRFYQTDRNPVQC